jgi:hypothetical protein
LNGAIRAACVFTDLFTVTEVSGTEDTSNLRSRCHLHEVTMASASSSASQSPGRASAVPSLECMAATRVPQTLVTSTFRACGAAVPTVVPDMVASALPTSASFAPLGTALVDAVPSGSPSTQTVGNVGGNHRVPAVNLTQAELQAACKRIHVSSSGAKAVLVNRLATKGFKYLQQVRQLAIEFEEQGRSKDVLHLTNVANQMQKSANWQRSEYFRLVLILADPTNQIICMSLCRKADDRAATEARSDPFASEFL